MASHRNQPSWSWRASMLLVLLLGLWTPTILNAEPTEVPVAQEEIVEEEGLPEEPMDSTNAEAPIHTHKEEPHCAWGTACHPEYVEGGDAAAAGTASADGKKSSGNASTSRDNVQNIPFVHHHHPGNGNIHVPPPEGFTIVARVYTDPNDKLAHFTDDEEGSHITLPYWECGATGSTTSPLPVKDAYFRHSLSGTKPHVWSGTEYGPHPQLVVALKRMEMTLNSGESKVLKAGDVVLLEDVVSGGHKLKALEGFDMTYLLLTLPQHYHHVGRDKMALKKASMEKKQGPCPDGTQQQQQHTGAGAFVNRQPMPNQEPLSSKSSWEKVLTGESDGQVAPLREPKLRKLLLGLIGVSFSTLAADFLARVAPLWLAVGIGGTCFVVGGTFGIVQGGDYVCSEIEMWQERRRLNVQDLEDIDADEMETPPMPQGSGATAA